MCAKLRAYAASLASYKELLIDYDHQSLRSAENGQLVPAAGWFSGLRWQEGQGLYATAIRWNKRAQELIAAREYRFISPVFSFDPSSGNVMRIISVAITNSPALPDLFDLSLAAASAVFKPAETQERIEGRFTPENQRGYELLARMMPSIPEYARLAGLCSTDDSVSAWSPPTTIAPEDQRGYELLARMFGQTR